MYCTNQVYGAKYLLNIEDEARMFVGTSVPSTGRKACRVHNQLSTLNSYLLSLLQSMEPCKQQLLCLLAEPLLSWPRYRNHYKQRASPMTVYVGM
jgi:hypothetical protein